MRGVTVRYFVLHQSVVEDSRLGAILHHTLHWKSFPVESHQSGVILSWCNAHTPAHAMRTWCSRQTLPLSHCKIASQLAARFPDNALHLALSCLSVCCMCVPPLGAARLWWWCQRLVLPGSFPPLSFLLPYPPDKQKPGAPPLLSQRHFGLSPEPATLLEHGAEAI
jgi:hypothetical protein